MRCGRKRPETPDRLQAVQNVLASVVDIGAKTDYDALDPDVELKRACCHGGPTRVTSVVGLDIGAKTDYDALDPDVETKRACCHGGPESLRQANGQCLSVGYRGHGII